jgi:hypothetical protein
MKIFSLGVSIWHALNRREDEGTRARCRHMQEKP